MNEVIETDKWMTHPMKSLKEDISESYTEFVLRLKRDVHGSLDTKKADLKELKGDLKDLGKWRRYKELRRDLEK